MSDCRISGLLLSGIGVFDYLDLEFKPCPSEGKAEIHIFTGENGTGKTTLLECLTLFDKKLNPAVLVKQQGKAYQDFVGRRAWGGFLDPQVEVKFRNGDVFSNSELSGEEKYLKEYYRFTGKHYPDKIDHAYFAYDSSRAFLDQPITVLQDSVFNPLEEALQFQKTKSNHTLLQWIANNITRSALAFQQGKEVESDLFKAKVQGIERAMSEIVGRKIQFGLNDSVSNVIVQIDGKEIHINSLAAGHNSMLSWLTDMLFRLDYFNLGNETPFTLFLDEIDNHLHPSAQRRILPVLQKLFPKAQIFLTTHSPFVLGSVDDAWIYKFKLNEEGNSVLAQEPFLSEDGNSYGYFLEEVFDIGGIKEFGIEVEKKLKTFYDIKDRLVADIVSEPDTFELKKIARDLASQSRELQYLINSEVRQLEKQKNILIDY